MAVEEVRVPNLGEFADVPVAEVLVKTGDAIEVNQPLLTLESDKATMDVPSSAAGVVKEVLTRVGDHVSEGSVILILESTDSNRLKADRPPSTSISAGVAPAVELPQADRTVAS